MASSVLFENSAPLSVCRNEGDRAHRRYAPSIVPPHLQSWTWVVLGRQICWNSPDSWGWTCTRHLDSTASRQGLVNYLLCGFPPLDCLTGMTETGKEGLTSRGIRYICSMKYACILSRPAWDSSVCAFSSMSHRSSLGTTRNWGRLIPLNSCSLQYSTFRSSHCTTQKRCLFLTLLRSFLYSYWLLNTRPSSHLASTQ